MPDTAHLIVALGLQDNLSSGLGRATSNLNKMTGSLGQVGKGIGQVSHGLGNILTRGALAAGAALTGVVATAASFEQAFTGVEKTVDGTDAQLAELEQTLRQMARTIPVSFQELSAIGEAGGALGVARDSLDEFIDVVARLSVSTNLSADAAATALGQLGTVLHLSGQDFVDFADSLVALGNAGASTEDQIVALAARFAAAGNSAGLTKEEILAISSAVASMGIEVEAGGTALSQTFNGITKAIGTGSDEVKAFTDTLGISAAEFKKRWTEDALGTFQSFLGELGKLDKFKQSAILEKAGITGIRQVNAVMLMTQNLGFFSDQLAISEHAQGALNKESQKFFDTTAGRWKVFRQNVADAAATIGTELLPITKDALDEFTKFLQLPSTQAGLKQFGQDLAKGISDLRKELQGTDFSGLIDGMKIAGEVARSAFDMFRKLPPELQTLAIGALAVNKLTGGAVTSIAKGLGNIIGGAVGIGGGLLGRGSSPANALWVQSVGGGIGGGVPGSLLKGGATIGIGSLLGITSAVGLGAILGNEIGHAVFFDPTVKPAVEFETSQFNSLLASNDPKELRRGLDAIDAGLRDLGVGAFDPFGIAGVLTNFFAGDQIRTLQTQQTAILDRLDSLPGRLKRSGSRSGNEPAFFDPLRGTADLVDPTIARLLKGRGLSDTAISRDVINPLLLPFEEQVRLTRQLVNRPQVQPITLNVGVPVYVNASLIAAKSYQIKTSARIREG